MMNAQRAYEVGFVNEVLPDDEIEAEAIRWAEMLQGIPPLYIKSVKYGLYNETERLVRKLERPVSLPSRPAPHLAASRCGRQSLRAGDTGRPQGRFPELQYGRGDARMAFVCPIPSEQAGHRMGWVACNS
jgi:hypothetical protein